MATFLCRNFSLQKRKMDISDNQSSLSNSDKPTYWLTRFMILRLLGIVYAVAFLVAINEIVPLIGSDGLTPVNIFLKQVSKALGSSSKGFLRLPSIFWWFHSDTALLVGAWIGFVLSLVVVAGYANVPLLAVLWFLYMSFVHVGQEWYGYGWEIQLTETGFLAIFLCPLLEMRPFPKHPPPLPIIILFRWLIFRIISSFKNYIQSLFSNCSKRTISIYKIQRIIRSIHHLVGRN